jgi:hypothetical protein
MMKKYLAVIALLISGFAAHAQNLTMSDITNLASLNNSEAHNSLTFERPFTKVYSEQVDGKIIDHYRGNTPSSKTEMVTIGYGGKSMAGNFLHTVKYETTNVNYIRSLITQAKSAGLKKEFQGADSGSNIYMFDSYLYTVNVYISNDNSKGSVTVRQNQLE